MQPCAAYSGGYRCGIYGKCILDVLKGALDSESKDLVERRRDEPQKTRPCAGRLLADRIVIGLLRGEAIVVSGTLQGVSWDEMGRRDYGLELYVNGDVYNIVRYSALSRTGRLNYGIEGDGMAEDVEILMQRLQQKTGQEIRLEYVPLAENGKLVVRLTVDGEEYIDEDEARRDHIRHVEAGRNTWITVCAVALILLVGVVGLALRER